MSLYGFAKEIVRPIVSLGYATVHGRRRFNYRGESFPYFFHPYNSAWRNERTVEIPIARRFLEGVPAERILEIGNVMGRYEPARAHTVVDRYEVYPGVTNLDVVEIPGPARFARILAISTIEHVGFDETPQDPDKIRKALDVLRGLLLPGGEAMITIPVGYNPILDAKLQAGEIPFAETRFLRKLATGWGWEETDGAACWGTAFDQRYQAGNALVVGYLRQPI